MALARMEFDPDRRPKPPEDRYAAPVLVEGQEHAWTMVVRCLSPSDDGWTWRATVQWLVAQAPHELLVPGFEFQLKEGPHVVARGVVLEG